MLLSGLKITITPQAREKILYWTEATTLEVSGLGLVDRTSDGFLITDVFIMKQVSSGSGTELDNEAVARLLLDLDKAGTDTGKLKCWWHSHSQMGVFWSGTDEACIKDLGGEQGEYFVSLVTNRKGELLLRLDIFRPFRATIDQLALNVGIETPGLREACTLEVKQKVEKATVVPAVFGYGGGRHNFPEHRWARQTNYHPWLDDEEWGMDQVEGLQAKENLALAVGEEPVGEINPELVAEVNDLRKRAREAEKKWAQSISGSSISSPPS